MGFNFQLRVVFLKREINLFFKRILCSTLQHSVDPVEHSGAALFSALEHYEDTGAQNLGNPKSKSIYLHSLNSLKLSNAPLHYGFGGRD